MFHWQWKVRPVTKAGVEQSWHALTAAHLSPCFILSSSNILWICYRLSKAVVARCSPLVTWKCVNACFLFSGPSGPQVAASQFLENVKSALPSEDLNWERRRLCVERLDFVGGGCCYSPFYKALAPSILAKTKVPPPWETENIYISRRLFQPYCIVCLCEKW